MKKLTAMLLALVMMALPFAGLAELDLQGMLDEVKVSLKETSGMTYQQDALDAGRRVTTNLTLDWLPESMTGDAAVDQVISDVIDNLSFTMYEETNETFFAVGMKQETTGEVADLINFGCATKGDEIYVSSNLLGGAFALTADEALPLLERLMDMLVMIGMIAEEDLEQTKAMLPEMMPMLDEYAELMASATAMNQLDVSTLKFTAISKAVRKIAARLEPTDVLAQAKNSDAAVSAVAMDITGQDAIDLIKAMAQFVKDNPVLCNYFDQYFAYMLSMEPSVAEELGAKDFTGLMDVLISELESSDMEGTLHLYMGLDANGRPVCAQLTAAEEEGGVVYTRLTQNEGVAHSVVFSADGVDMTFSVLDAGDHAVIGMAAAEDGVTMMNMQMDITNRSVENMFAYDMTLVMDVNDEEMPISIKFDITEDTVLNGIDFTSNANITVSLNGMELLAIKGTAVTSEPGASITDGEVVHPAQLSEADFANWFVGVYESLFSWVYGVIMKLPVSVQNLLMSGY